MITEAPIHDQLDQPVGNTPEQLGFTRDPVAPAVAAKSLLWILLAVLLISLVFDFALLDPTYRSASSVESREMATRQGTVAIFQLIAYIAVAVAFFIWVHRANTNVRGFGVRLRFSPGWAVGCFFVPFLNLFMPYQAIKEIWKSGGGAADKCNQVNFGLVECWWALYLISAIVRAIGRYMISHADAARQQDYAVAVTILAGIIEICLVVASIMLISKISQMQQKLVSESQQAPRLAEDSDSSALA